MGAVLNATFGSVVELILYVSTMVKGKKGCYVELVKAALTGLFANVFVMQSALILIVYILEGTLLATMLLIPVRQNVWYCLDYKLVLFYVRVSVWLLGASNMLSKISILGLPVLALLFFWCLWLELLLQPSFHWHFL